MTPIEYKKFCDETQKEFFGKYKNPKCKARNFRRNTLQSASNIIESVRASDYKTCPNFDPDFFVDASNKITEFLKA